MTESELRARLDGMFRREEHLCAELVVRELAEAGGKDPQDAVRMATGFCSGLARTCGQCGAVSGAVMGMGLLAGHTAETGDYDPVYAIVQEFKENFEKEFGSTNCFGLIECDFNTAEGQQRYKEEDKREKCLDAVVFSVETALSILREHGYLAEEAVFTNSRLAPCGLVCGNCVAFEGGPVQRLSSGLKAQLGDNFAEYAKRFEGMNPVFSKYADFAELLDFLASGSCTGCREQGCLFQSCRVTECVREQGVDYCFQCGEFPCDRHGFPERLETIWRRNNNRMQETGSTEWFRLCKDKPRYP
ncbi:C-GCAxxG-C-C family (seleno)protein [Pseudodesulfovibrio portus]|uniref:C_GCAxxG_C_C family protein n=1 Tax=Pseudodesulfovibrio portus TaxID=231439 RepID=A0ABN6RTX5_9BACT|nr:C-GCAxxG-C-C family (seleno)protein [Pseudodesulfovibrio portus]BDQ34154.1 hypothetical protein JCM14722_16960 [Pseudodesulfovibrio portus]